MVKIRLKRVGRKKRPFYRIVATDIRSRRDGAPLAELGYYNPISRELKLDKPAALAWVAKGAIPSPTAQRLMDKASETGELVKLESKQGQKLSKKAKAKAEADAEAAKQAKEAEVEAAKQAKEAETAKAEAEEPAEEAAAAAE
ncbi:MAG: 30S ribosomal protein S16 [Vampirovibrionales bacterium]|nr:30S ribosomal protein S16 [Vampirovibrionales bacterium]